MRLAIHEGETLLRDIVLDQGVMQIGRGDQNDIVLPDESYTVSRVHACLRYENLRYVLDDLASANGIWVSDHRVSSVELQPDMPVTIGPYSLVLHGDQPRAPAYPSAVVASADAGIPLRSAPTRQTRQAVLPS